MSPDTIAVGVFGIAGTLIGVAFGQWLEDRRRRRGEVRREVRAWTGGSTGTVSESRVFEVRFFNDRDVNISLWDAQVECYRGDELTASIATQQASRRNEKVRPIDLESRKSVYVTMEVEAEGEMLSILKNSDRLEFVAMTVPGGEKVRESLRTWDPLHPQ